MRVLNLNFCAIFTLLTSVFSYDNYAQIKGCCTFNGPGFEDIEYIITNRFNEKLMMEYNSTQGNWTGFTPFAIEKVKYWNADPADALLRAFEKRVFCTEQKDVLHRQADNFTVVPTIKLNSVKQSSGGYPAMLVCTAYNFYPKQIRMTWLRNGQEMTSGVSTSDVMSDGNWYYQIHSYLEYVPTAPEKITCMVEHPSLSVPVLHVWDPSLPVPEQIKIAVGLCGLMLGFVIVSSGFFYYKRKSAAYIAFCQGRVSVPVEELTAAGAT